ncbi:DNA internalization-related competence protein ComEC/Rec2 [Desulfosporosinus fructosivorans]|uniref:DNA internalization-related competence protein ComEC/Rec2 n=1 Tax=Desulfosporosinus fructosivorans TaxID=2018669 RepID=A0A4Z0RBI8_9FIRM|nr:DNA internalization-related competence protein ComEC/Rec2 [Desulfosporosinus fructosivorans]TGE39824.1 DNA internalization-related competence protein ComEC/Rec2 [Desulfosporosinus fructosivorans]
MKDPWIGRATALLIGGVSGAYLPEQARLWAFGVLILLGVRLVFWRPRDFFGRVFRPEILLLGASLLFGNGYGALADRTLLDPISLDHVGIVGHIQDWNISEDKIVGIVRVEEVEGGTSKDTSDTADTAYALGEHWRGLYGQSYRLTVYADRLEQIPGEWMRVQQGDRVSFLARLERPKPIGTPGAFDLRLYYAVRGLSGTLSAQGDAVLLSAGQSSLTWKIRQQVRSRLQVWDPEETGVLEGILFGDSSRIPDVVQERYKVTGVLHVFAASGSNVAFVLGLSWMLLRFLPKQLRISGTVVVLLLYAALCGGNAPIVRATVLGIVVLLGRLGRGNVATLRWLCLAAVALFIQNPLIIKDLGFQLSFAAAWGLVVLAPRILKGKWLERLPKLLRFAVAGTLAAQVATLPLLISAFHRLSLIGFFANVFILFILGSVLEVGLVGVILSFSGWLSAPFFQASLWLLAGTNTILKMLAEIPYADVWVLNPGPLFWIIWYGGMGIILWGRERVLFAVKVSLIQLSRGLSGSALKILEHCPLRLRGVLQRLQVTMLTRVRFREWLPIRIGGIVLIVLFLWSPWNLQNDLEVVLIDVGQGDAILIRTPENHAILLDAGPRSDRFDAGERIVLPYLLQSRIGHLDALLITHEHQDHIGGVRAVLANIPTDWVGIPDVAEQLENEEWQEGLPFELLYQSERLRTLQVGDRIELDSGAWLDVLGPTKVLRGTHSDPNNNSLVLKLNYMGQSIMLTADMEQEEMEEIFETGVDLENSIFKVPHHGSRFSLYHPWLDGIHPQAVCISVGKNTFGHPSPEVLNYWEERHIPVYRTDEHGTIQFRIGERGVDILPGR